ncbi:hypothetical protein JHK87_006765 [Glycine soja]|nr:hypothetical protein JHK87_006765 [Glycine soja]
MAAELGQQTVELSTLVTGVAHDNLSCAALTYQMTYHVRHGYMVGNGVTDEQIDGNALVPFVHGMRLIPDELFEDDEVANTWLNNEAVRTTIHTGF